VARKSWVVVSLAACATSAGLAATSATAHQAQPSAAQGSSKIEVLSLWGGSEKAAFLKVLDAFTKKTGIKTQYTTARDFLPVIRTRLAAGKPPQVAIVPRPGIVADLARQGKLKPLQPMGITKAMLAQRYSKAWLDLGTVDGKIYGFTAKANSKSVIWYKPDTFKSLGVKVPKTWAGLQSVVSKIKASGKTPWALGAKDSWTLTDWFENIYARQAGPVNYQALFTGKLKFTDKSVETAIQTMDKVLTEDNVAGGIQGALGTAFVDGIGRVFGTKPSAELYMEGGFVGGIALGDVNPKLKPGKTISSFPFPPINGSFGNPLVGGGDVAVAFVDDPNVRKLMTYLASSEAGKIWVSTGAIVSPNKQVPASAYPNVLVRAEAAQVAGAQSFNFDGSDLLPGSLGDKWGSTLQQALQKPDDVEDLLDDFQNDAEGEFTS